MKIKTAVLTIICLSASFVGGSFAAVSASSQILDIPTFAFKPIRASSGALISGVNTYESADIVMLDGGIDKGFGVGMSCEVFNNKGKVGDVILVEVQRSKAAGLILNLEAGEVINPGDVATIKTLTLAE
jgi:hypothetical protein